MDIDAKVTFATGWRRFTFMEPSIFLLMLNYGMTETVFTDMIVYRSCRSMLATNRNSCDLLHTDSGSEEALEIDKVVQPHASYIILCDSLIDGIIPAALILFLGPWSDKFGRKPLLITGYLAPTFHYIIVSILNHWDVDPWMFLTASVPSALVGGGAGVMLASFCFISDITSSETRTWQLACFEGCLTAGLLVGTVIGPLIFQQFGYVVLFGVASVLSVVALLHIILYVPETVQNEVNAKWGNPFDLRLVKELFETSIKKRPGLNRWSLWNCILVLSLFVIIVDGEINISYLFMNARLGWNSVQYSIYKSISMILSIMGTMLGLKVMKNYLGVSDVIEALIGCISGFLISICTSFASKPWHLYMGTSLGIFSGMISPTIRSLLSTSAPPDDMGKIFSLITFLETVLPLGGVSLYTLVYTNYMPPVYPSPVYLLSGGIFFFMMIFVILIDAKMFKYTSAYHEPIEED